MWQYLEVGLNFHYISHILSFFVMAALADQNSN